VACQSLGSFPIWCECEGIAYIFAAVVIFRCRVSHPYDLLRPRNEVVVERVHDLGQFIQDGKLAAHEIGE